MTESDNHKLTKRMENKHNNDDVNERAKERTSFFPFDVAQCAFKLSTLYQYQFFEGRRKRFNAI